MVPTIVGQLEPFNAPPCACGKPALFTVEVTFKWTDGTRAAYNVPVCETHASLNDMVGDTIRLLSYPSHQDILVREVSEFPPRRAELCLKNSLSLGCPKCGNLVGLDSRSGGPMMRLVYKEPTLARLEPSFICPHTGCGLHAWIWVAAIALPTVEEVK